MPASSIHQARVLTARYRACLLGDFGTLVVLIAQAPLIGWLCTLVWGAVDTDTPSLYFVLCLSAVWFGCINACREIVKERELLERERFFGLSLGAYVWSKIAVLSGLGLVQVLLLQMTVETRIGLSGPFLLHTAALFGASVTGTTLGLLVSAIARRQERAVGVVPLLILPQILFSEMPIPKAAFDEAVELGEKLMPVHWAYRVFEEAAAADPDWLLAAGSLALVAAYGAVMAVATVVALIPRRA